MFFKYLFVLSCIQQVSLSVVTVERDMNSLPNFVIPMHGGAYSQFLTKLFLYVSAIRHALEHALEKS